MDFNVDDISLKELNIEDFYSLIEFIKTISQSGKPVSDEMFSWLINPPPIYAAIKTDEIEEIMKKHAMKYEKNKQKSLTITRSLKKEFYDFMCTESEYYNKERKLIGGNINIVITGVAAAIATKMGNIEIGIVTSFIAAFIIVLGKVGKKAICESFKPESTS